MHVHILGIGGTFMGGIAALAQAAGHRVTGSDRAVYPPMSTQLESLGVQLIEGYDPDQLDLRPDVVVVGNVMSRGQPIVERLLDSGLAYTSGPQWLAENVLPRRWTLAVAGTHGKTTTTSMLAWILDRAGLDPGFLIGGVASDFPASARLGTGPHFVVEADEYDAAFFDKRAKFVHYRPRTAVLNNLEYDHADIYPDVAAIQRQFHQLVRTVPGGGRILHASGDPLLAEALAMGCWTPRESFSADPSVPADWSPRLLREDGSAFAVVHRGREAGSVEWRMIGQHNVANGLAAIAAAFHAGVGIERGCQALSGFGGVRRRLEVRGCAGGVTIYDDFAHHPTAIRSTLEGLRRRVGDARILAVLEPRSNTMKLGVHRGELAASLAAADRVWLHQPPDLGWNLGEIAATMGSAARVSCDIDQLAESVATVAQSGDHVLIMSNGSFGGVHELLLARLRRRSVA